MLDELVSELRYRLRAVFRRRQMERELDDELRFHVENEAEKLVRTGVTPDVARRQALLAFGGVNRIKDDTRDARGVSLLEILLQHLRDARRGLTRNPGFTAAVVVTLALGIGANAAMFDIVDRLLYRPPNHLRDPSSVHRVYLSSEGRRGTDAGYVVEYTRYLDLQRNTRSFSAIAGFRMREHSVGDGDAARLRTVGVATANLFDFFDARPTLGRFFTAAEDVTPAGAPVVVLADAYWRSDFGARRDVLGSKLRVGAIIYTIIGVAPPTFAAFSSSTPPAVWVPATTYASSMTFQKPGEYYTQYTWSWLELVARRKPGVSVEAANADMTHAFVQSWDAAVARDPRAPHSAIASPRAVVVPIQTWRRPPIRPEAKVLAWIAGVALIVLLVACANVANLQLARTFSRQREIAVRLALGVSRGRLFGQLMTESVILGLAGGMAGLVVASAGSVVLQQLFIPGAADGRALINPRTLVVAVALAIITGVIAGLAPAFNAIRRNDRTTLTLRSRHAGVKSRVRTSLVVVQCALSAVLLVGAGLFVRSLSNIRGMRLGYDVDNVAYVSWDDRSVRLDSAGMVGLSTRLRDAAAATPGVISAARVITAPFDRTSVNDLFVEGIDSVARLGAFTMQASSPELFTTLGTRILRGRPLTTDDRFGAARVAVVSESMAQILWPGRDALGMCFRIRVATGPCTTVVGVAEDAKQNSITRPDAFHYYLPADQYERPTRGVFVRVKGRSADETERLRRVLQPLMPSSSLVQVRPFRAMIDPSMRSWEFGATMFLAFGALALVVAAFGLYSVISYHVAQRRHEIGVRVALGARGADVLKLVIGEGLRFGLVGVFAGVVIAFAGARWIEPLLFNVGARDPVVAISVALLLSAVAVLASGAPALRASRIDPSTALRAD